MPFFLFLLLTSASGYSEVRKLFQKLWRLILAFEYQDHAMASLDGNAVARASLWHLDTIIV